MNSARFLPRRVSPIVAVFADARKAKTEEEKKYLSSFRRYRLTNASGCCPSSRFKGKHLVGPTIHPVTVELKLRSSLGNSALRWKKKLSDKLFCAVAMLATLKEMLKLPSMCVLGIVNNRSHKLNN